MTEEWMRFLSLMRPGAGKPEVILGRRERVLMCTNCERLHSYNVQEVQPEMNDPALFDAWEDAAAYARKRLPEAEGFGGWREDIRDDQAADSPVTILDDREAAIRWLLA